MAGWKLAPGRWLPITRDAAKNASTNAMTNAMNEDTATATLPPPSATPASVAPPPWYNQRWFYRLGWFCGVAAVLGVLLFVVPAQWVGRVIPGHSVVDDDAVAFKPGSASGTGSRVFIAGVDQFEPEGSFLFTTVVIDDDVSIAEWIESSIRDSYDLRTRESVFGSRTATEQRERNLQLMQVSKDTAVVVALQRLGIQTIEASGVGFEETLEGEAADGNLFPGDVIVAIDDDPVTSLQSLQDLLATRGPGTVVVITVEDIESLERRDVDLTMGVHPDNDGGFIGIGGVAERLTDIVPPFDVDIESGTVGGPSAGLAFTLTILDLLTPGELTGGYDIAVTGTISLDENIGNVGGVRQKAAAANASGAELFIVPAASEDAALKGAGGMAVVGVETLDEALAALADLGGNVDQLELP